MNPNPLMARFEKMTASLREEGWLRIEREGDRLLVTTGDRVVRHSRRLIRAGGALASLAGAALLFYSAWGWALLACGLATLLFAPRFAAYRRLLEIDTADATLILQPNTGVEGGTLPVAGICALRGVYETKGWDPYSVLYAEQRDGTQIPILLLMGGAETLASHACRTLGSLLDCPATYTGPFGDIKACYEPAGQKLEQADVVS